jgi:hypothetical protein
VLQFEASPLDTEDVVGGRLPSLLRPTSGGHFPTPCGGWNRPARVADHGRISAPLSYSSPRRQVHALTISQARLPLAISRSGFDPRLGRRRGHQAQLTQKLDLVEVEPMVGDTAILHRYGIAGSNPH